MALQGRLYKDRFLASNAKAEARKFAYASAEKYAHSFKVTGGIYSGVNGATMTLMAGGAITEVEKIAQQVLEKAHYYHQMTMAEVYFLRDGWRSAKSYIQKAVDHDPQNYAAHATWLKQFHMIAAKKEMAPHRLRNITAPLMPPKSLCFVGHLFGIKDEHSSGKAALSLDQIDELKERVRDLIQQQDIGFGFGALAVGADLVIAQTLLEEGCDLHIFLPVQPELFKAHSVELFGNYWEKIYQQCIEKAATLTVTSNAENWPSPAVDIYASQLGMGACILHANKLISEPLQLAISDGEKRGAGTSRAIMDWKKTGFQSFTIPFPEKRPPPATKEAEVNYLLQLALVHENCSNFHHFDQIEEAVAAARHYCEQRPDCTQAVMMELTGTSNPRNEEKTRIIAKMRYPAPLCSARKWHWVYVFVTQNRSSFILRAPSGRAGGFLLWEFEKWIHCVSHYGSNSTSQYRKSSQLSCK